MPPAGTEPSSSDTPADASAGGEGDDEVSDGGDPPLDDIPGGEGAPLDDIPESDYPGE